MGSTGGKVLDTILVNVDEITLVVVLEQSWYL